MRLLDGLGPQGRGTLLVLASAAAYGTMPVLVRIAYADGVSVPAVLLYRFLFAALLFAVLQRRTPRPPLRARLALWGLGGIFLGNTLTYFLALERVPVSVVTLLLYTYPVLVTLFAAALGIERLTTRSLLSAALAFAGSALTVGSLADAGAAGVLLALAAAAVYASYLVLASRLARGQSSVEGARHVSEVAVVAYGLWAGASGELVPSASPRGWAALLAIGAVCTVLALRGLLAGLALVGPSRAAVLSSFEVLVAVGLAVAFLGERPGWRTALGGALIAAGVAVGQPRGAVRPGRNPPPDRPLAAA